MKSISLQQRQNKSSLHAWMNQLIAVKANLVICVVLLGAVQANGQQRPPELQSVNWVPGSSGFLAPSGNVGTLTKNGGGTTAAWNAGAVSGQRILRDGQVTFKVTAASQMTVGLSLVSANEGNAEIDFAINVLPTNIAQVYQNGSAGASLGPYTTTTEFSIRRTGSKIEYLKDGFVLNTSTLVSAGSLTVDCSMAKLNSAITSAQIATGDLDNDGMADNWEEGQLPPLHSWADVTNFLPGNDSDLDGVSNLVEFQTGTLATDSLSRSVPMNWLRAVTSQLNTDLTANAGGIVKLAPGYATQYDARAFASQAIAEDGQMMFKVTPGTSMTVGLNTSDVMPNPTIAVPFPAPDLEWAIITADNGTFFVKPNAANVPSSAVAIADSRWAYTSDTVFCIRRTAGQIQFLKDGVVMHTAAAASVGPLYPNVWLSSPTAELTLARIDTGDMDNDLLSDVWERQHLRPDSGWNDLLGFTPIGNSDGNVIINHQPVSSGDTISNADELRDGTSPIDPLSKSESVVWRSDGVNALVPSGSTLGELTKSSSTAGYNARAFGTQVILEDGLVVFQVSGNGVMTLGLNASNVMPLATNGTPSTTILAPDQEWAFTTTAAGTYTVKPNAAVVTPTVALNTYNADTRLMIQRVGGVVRFLRNGVVVHTAAAKSSGPLYVNVWMSTPAQQVTLARVYTGDVDTDGMPDAWELSYLANHAVFTELDAFKASGAGVASDSDGDGVQNIDEYFDGTNPLRALIKPATLLWKGNSTTPAAVASLPTIDDSVGGVKKTSAAGWTVDAVASKLANVNDPSSARLPLAIRQTGRLSFTAKATSSLAVGLTYSNDNRTQNDLEFMIQLAAAGTASVFEGTGGAIAAVSKASLGSYDANTRFSIRRVLGQIEYLKDGVVYYTSAVSVSASAALFADTSFNTVNSEITAARLYTGDVDADGMEDEWEITQYQRLNSGSLPTYAQLEAFAFNGDEDHDGANNLQEYLLGTDALQQLSVADGITWANFTSTINTPLIAGTSVAPGYLRKTTSTPTTGYTADATSTQALPGDGTYSFSVLPGVLTVGFTSVAGPSNINNADTDLPYAILFSATDAKAVRPETATDLSLGAYTASTVFAIRRTGAVIEFLKDGVVVETSTTASSGSIYADCSLSGGTITQIVSAYLTNDDTNNDGISDSWALAYLPVKATAAQLSAFFAQSMGPDNDSVSNLEEYLNGTSPILADTDGDGMSDRWELDWGLAATDASNADVDLDSDGLSNLGEFMAGTNPFDADCDDDEMLDGYEVTQGLNPFNSEDLWADKDGDKVPNFWEYKRGTLAGSISSLPAWDAIVDPALPNSLPSQKKYKSLGEAFYSLPANSSYRATILLKRFSAEYNYFSISNDSERCVAIVGEGGAEISPTYEGAIFDSISYWSLRGELVFNGVIFDGVAGNGIQINEESGNVSKVKFVNCLFRHQNVQRTTNSYNFDYGGSLTNFGGEVYFEHCTFLDCNSYGAESVLLPDDTQGLCTIANLSGTISLKNCILWDNGYPSSIPISGLTTSINIESCLIQGGMQRSLDQNPNLTCHGYLTAVSTHCFSAGANVGVKKDLQGQTRSSSGPSLGAVEWISSDGDSVPDWWELWWYSHTNFTNTSIPNPVYANITLLVQYLNEFWAGPFPTLDNDTDGLRDQWELDYFGDLSQTTSGNPDGDARTNIQEQAASTNPWSKDNDYDSEPDGLHDNWELTYFNYDITLYSGGDDPDGDSLPNWYEHNASQFSPFYNLQPTRDDDLDDDELADPWEIAYWGSITEQIGTNDPDQDGLTNRQEMLAGSNPKIHSNDSDEDGMVDSSELNYFGNLERTGTDDFDKDGLSDFNEVQMTGTNPTNKDTNGDGYLDGFYNSFAEADGDGDDLSNAQEAALGTNPRLADSDGDGVQDGTDAYPLNGMMQNAIQSNPLDTTAPILTLAEPLDAQLLP